MNRRNVDGLAPLVIFVAVAICTSCTSGRAVTLSAESVADWPMWGRGSVELAKPDTLRLREGRDSGGVVLLSPDDYPRNMVLRFQARAEAPDGVNVVFLAVSPVEGAALSAPEGYDGAFALWNGPEARIRNYTFAFHTAYHQPNAFVSRNPGAVKLAEAPDLAAGLDWHAIEVGRWNGRLWLSVDGNLIFETTESEEILPGGRIGFRVRGPGDGSYASLFRRISIESER